MARFALQKEILKKGRDFEKKEETYKHYEENCGQQRSSNKNIDSKTMLEIHKKQEEIRSEETK